MRNNKKTYILVFGVFLLIASVFLAVGNNFAKAEETFLIEPKKTEDSTSKEQRTAQRKEEFKSQVDELAEKKLSAKCEQTAKTVKNLREKDSDLLMKRHDIYVNNSDRLDFIIGNLQSRGISTAGVQTARQAFITATNKYMADAADYKSAIDDLAQIDCSKDPAAYKSTILSARKLRQQLALDAKAVKTSLGQVKTAVEEAKKVLLAKPGSN